MSSLLPVPTPAPRPRNLQAAPTSPDRRTDTGATAFASSLATARAGTARVDRGDSAAARSRAESPQQRAQVQSMMLSGAMKYAATRSTPTSGAAAATEHPDAPRALDAAAIDATANVNDSAAAVATGASGATTIDAPVPAAMNTVGTAHVDTPATAAMNAFGAAHIDTPVPVESSASGATTIDTPVPVESSASGATTIDTPVHANVVIATDTASNAAHDATDSGQVQAPSTGTDAEPTPAQPTLRTAAHSRDALRAQLRDAMTVAAQPAPVQASDARVEVVQVANLPAPVLADLTSTPAATVAALQLLATLPLPLPATPVAVETESAPAERDSQDTDERDDMLLLDDSTSSHDHAKSAVLVEDHFDAPAAAIDTTMSTTVAGSAYAHASAPVPGAMSHVGPTAPADAPPAASAATSSHSGAPSAAIERASVHDVDKALAQLSPEFRDRLQRVIDRMTSEYGHTVSVVETVRSQARQDALFAQGRTTDGPVVTWTTNSKHVAGLAADVMVDGRWDNPAGYAHLAAIARQEGLRTLGARDPGHLELAGDAVVSADTLETLLGDLRGQPGDQAPQRRADGNGDGRGDSHADVMARVANVAQVARVANVADVARVATVATPGASSRDAGSNGNAGSSNGTDAVSPLAVSGTMPMMMSDTSVAPRVQAPTASVNMADRISQLMDIQATQSARPLSSVLLRMENANGIEDQIRIDTRGTSVDARLGVGNAQQAAAITDRLGELREALERRGLSAEGVRAHAAPRAVDSVNFSRPTAPGIELAGLRAAAESQSQGNTRDQSSRDQQQREASARAQDRHNPRSSTDDSRHRSRREQPEDRR